MKKVQKGQPDFKTESAEQKMVNVIEKIEMVDVDILVLYEKKDFLKEVNPLQLEALEKSLLEHGFLDALLVNRNPEQPNVIIGGNLIYSILKKNGVKKVPVIYIDKSAEEANQIYIKLNRQAFLWNFEYLTEVFEIDELKEWGFENSELNISVEEPKFEFDSANYESKKDRNATTMNIACSSNQRVDLSDKLRELQQKFNVKNTYEVIIKLIENYENNNSK